jgi:hypothetical protein
MKLERYYSSVREEVSPLADDANTLLERQDYVGFFKACGPNYVRGIRRAQEVTAIFTFQSNSSESSKAFAASLSVTAPGAELNASASAKSKFSSMSSSMTITIKGYGMRLNQEGSGTLVATSLEEYQEVMKFAFKSFTQNEDSPNIGMIYGIEVVPWVNNVAFQVAAQVHDENVELPLPRSLIPRGYLKLTPHTLYTLGTARADYTCKEPSFYIDKFGYCCEGDALYQISTKTYVFNFDLAMGSTELDTELDLRMCRPIRSLDKALVKDNMSTNGEFVANLDTMLRYKLNQLATLSRCVSASKSLPDRYDFNLLKSQDYVKYDGVVDPDFTLYQLRRAVDPLSNFGMVTQMGRELDEWIEMYYSPCLAAIYGSNIGTTPGTDPQYFLAYPWHRHPQCMQLSCLALYMRWDRVDGGCVGSVLNGQNAPLYVADEPKCAKDMENTAGTEETCKVPSATLVKFQTDVNECWNDAGFTSGTVDYYVDHYCMPQLTDNILASTDPLHVNITALKTAITDKTKCQVTP